MDHAFVPVDVQRKRFSIYRAAMALLHQGAKDLAHDDPERTRMMNRAANLLERIKNGGGKPLRYESLSVSHAVAMMSFLMLTFQTTVV